MPSNTMVMCGKQNRRVGNIEDEEDVGSDNEVDFLSNINVLSEFEPIVPDPLVNSVKQNDKPCYLKVRLNNIPVSIEVDTGAVISAMSKREFDEKFRGTVQLDASNKNYKGVDGHVLPVVGKIDVQASYKERWRLLIC